MIENSLTVPRRLEAAPQIKADLGVGRAEASLPEQQIGNGREIVGKLQA
jgi:hypothetical protein